MILVDDELGVMTEVPRRKLDNQILTVYSKQGKPSIYNTKNILEV